MVIATDTDLPPIPGAVAPPREGSRVLHDRDARRVLRSLGS